MNQEVCVSEAMRERCWRERTVWKMKVSWAEGDGGGRSIVDGMSGIWPAMWTVQGRSWEEDVDMAWE